MGIHEGRMLNHPNVVDIKEEKDETVCIEVDSIEDRGGNIGDISSTDMSTFDERYYDQQDFNQDSWSPSSNNNPEKSFIGKVNPREVIPLNYTGQELTPLE